MTPTLEQLLRVPHVDSGYAFDLSPDGAHIAFSWNKSGTWEIYEARPPAGGGSDGEPRVITSPAGGKFRPRYSPDGTRLAYALDLDGGESFHVAVFDLATGQHTDLTPDVPFAHQPNISWSPDGRELAVLSDAGGTFACYLLPAGGGSERLVLDVGHPCWDARWSPDGEWIAVDVEWHGQDRSIFLVRVQGGERRQLLQSGVPLNAMHPAWSPDGATLAFCADPTGWHRIGLYDVESQGIRWLEASTGEETSPAWSPDGRRLVSIGTHGADTWLRVHDLTDDSPTVHRMAPGVYSHPRFSLDGSRILFGFESPRSPNDLWQLELTTGSFSQLTHSLPSDVDTGDFVLPEEVRYASMDGVDVPAMLYRPLTQRAPALVDIHGGPNWLFQFNWRPLMSYLAAHGWAVLAPNYRGSTGYGRLWAQASRGLVGVIDTHDCAAGAHYLVREKLADPGRITVSGRSHGGYLTMTCLTEFPDLWTGGSAVVPFMNWFTSHEAARHDLQHWDIENLGDPVENAAVWRRRSPFFYLDRIRAGVQLICGANDPRCPASESIAAHGRLQELGKRVELILYPDEGHGFLKRENVIDHELQRLRFLEQVAVLQHPPAA
jgi:dipeptidyl aminopeptidase/acylaminoacyl peptidase